MDIRNLIKPDKGFAQEVMGRGGDSLQKCYQCSTCTVVCPVSPDDSPFPRKEMIWAQWGLKDRLMKDPDIWLCQRCGDCSAECPRDAKPGEVMAAVRDQVIASYAFPGFMGKAFSSPRYLPLLFVIPALLVIAYLALWGDLGFPDPSDPIIIDNFIPDWHGDIGVFMMFGIMFSILGIGLFRFWQGLTGENDTHDVEVKIARHISFTDFLKGLWGAILEIALHSNFRKCETSRTVYWAHLLIFYGCISLFAATAISFFLTYVVGMHAPWGILSASKILGAAGTFMAVVGLGLAIYRRLGGGETVGNSSYADWLLLVLLLLAVLSGFGVWMLRISESAPATYWVYLVHIIMFFEFFIYLPFTKASHMFYRLIAMAYTRHIGRGVA